MSKNNQTIHLGDYAIEVSTNKKGSTTAKLRHGFEFGVVEFEKASDKIRIKEMNLGSAVIEVEHLALLLFHAKLADVVAEELAKVKAYYGENEVAEKDSETIHLGDYVIHVTKSKKDTKVAKLSHGLELGVLEFEKTEDKIRIKEMNWGSAFIEPEHFALLLHHSDLLDVVAQEIVKVKTHYEETDVKETI